MRRSTTTSGSTRHRATDRSVSRAQMRVPIVALVAVAIVLVVAGFAIGRVAFSAASGRMEHINAPEVVVGEAALASTATPVASASAGMVEVPELIGMRADEAIVVLETAGFKVALTDAGREVSSEAKRLVVAQQPARGTVLSVDSTVTIAAPPCSSADFPAKSSGTKDSSPKWVVCIDPGHQAHTDTKLEPIGPGSKTEKPRATGGSTGVATGVPEYEVALQISMNLKRRLEAAGVKVVMVRTTNDVGVPNSARAKIANEAKADLFIRIHGGASTDAADSGIAVLYPSRNKWTARIVAPSRAAAKTIQQAACAATGAKERGARVQSGMSGFNWSKVPSVLVEAGFLSNPVEDRLMSSPQYQDKLAQGITDGVLDYLNGAR